MDSYKLEIDNAKKLTQQCYAQTSSSSGYTGPTTRSGNPWYNYNTRTSYTEISPNNFHVYSDKEYDAGTYMFYDYYGCYLESSGRRKTGSQTCLDLDDRLFYDYEKILNIW